MLNCEVLNCVKQPSLSAALVLLCALALVPIVSFGQGPDFHSGPYTDADTALVIDRYTRGFHSAYSKSDSAFIYTRQSIAVARGIPYPHGEAMAVNILGIVFDITGQYDSSLHCYREAIGLANEHGLRKIEAQAYNNIGLIHWNNSSLDSAIDYYFRSAEIYKTLNAPRGMGNSYNNVGLIYYDQRLFDRSLEFFREALVLYKQLNEPTLIGSALNNIGMSLTEVDQQDSAVWYYEQAILNREEVKDWYGLSKTLTNLGMLYRDLGRHDEVEPTLLEAIRHKHEVDDKYGLSSTHLNLAIYYHEDLKDYAKALASNTTALEIAEANDFTRILDELYRHRASVLMALDKPTLAYEFLMKATQLADSLGQAENTEKRLELETRYATAQKQHKIELLTKNREILDLANAKQRNQNIALIVLIVLLLLGGSFLYLWLRNRQRHALQEEQIKQQELGLQAVIQTQEVERKRIARELHDGVGQLLSGLKLTWGQLKDQIDQLPVEEQQVYTSSTELLDEAVSEVRSISHQMMPRALSHAGLVPAVEALLEKSIGHSGINYNFESYGLTDRYTEQVEVGVYRILQEVVGNVLKHAKANFFSVQLFRAKNQLVLVVEDNGIGMKKAPEGSGLGLTNIRTRAHSIDGVVNFSSGPEGGTLFTLRAPLV